MVDVQHTLQAIWGLDRIVLRREQSLPRVQLFAVQKAVTPARVAAFAFVGLRNVLASYRQKVTSFKFGRAGRNESYPALSPCALSNCTSSHDDLCTSLQTQDLHNAFLAQVRFIFPFPELLIHNAN